MLFGTSTQDSAPKKPNFDPVFFVVVGLAQARDFDADKRPCF